MAAVRAIFDELIGEDIPEISDQPELLEFSGMWQDSLEDAELAPLVPQLDDEQRRALHRALDDFRQDISRRTIGPRGRLAIDQLMPRLLSEVCPRDDAAVTFSRLVPLLLGVLTRSTYLELLTEYHGALRHLIRLCAASPM
ncbi:hypothetical protein, partial [Cytobacillus sp. AMY 15.2]